MNYSNYSFRTFYYGEYEDEYDTNIPGPYVAEAKAYAEHLIQAALDAERFRPFDPKEFAVEIVLTVTP